VMPTLMADGVAVTEDSDKAQLLLKTFFPLTAPPAEEAIGHREQLPWERLGECEISRALDQAKKRTAAGPDGLPLLVWQNL